MAEPILQILQMAFTKAGDDKLNSNFGDAFQLKPDCSKLLDLSTAKSPCSAVFVFWTLQMSDVFFRALYGSTENMCIER